MFKINLKPRQVLAWVFGAFAVIPFGLWTYQQITTDSVRVLGEWPMLVVTVVFTALSLIVANKETAGRLASGMVGTMVGIVRAKGGIKKQDLPPDE